VLDGVTPDLSAYRTAEEQDEIDDAQDEQIDDLKSALNTKAGILRDTASGSVASFVPDASVPNLLGMTVDIEPVQDLHGYDSPWPAGGGKNKFDPSAVTFKKWHLNSNSFATIPDSSSLVSVSVDGEEITITNPAAYYGVGFEIDAADADRVFSVPSTIGGAVQFWSAYEDGATRISTGSTSCAIPANTSGFIAFRHDVAGSVTTKAQLELGSTATSWTPYSNLCPISGHDSVTVNANGTTHTIQLGDTVYGGTLDVTNGTLTVDRAMVDLGTLNYTLNNHATLGQYFWCDVYSLMIKRAGEYSSTVYPSICSAFKCVSRNVWAFVNGTYCFDGGAVRVTQIQFKDSAYSDADSFKAAMSGVMLVYELATPITIQLDPVQIATIANQPNNVWADAGDVSVEFAADLKTYIDNKIAAAVAAMS